MGEVVPGGLGEWESVEAFRAADPRRSGPAEVEFGSLWMAGVEDQPWRLCWVEATGELVVVQRRPGWGEGDGPVEVLAVCAERSVVERGLQSWWQVCGHLGSLPWARRRAAELSELDRHHDAA